MRKVARLLFAIALVVLVAPHAAEAQPPAKVAPTGYLSLLLASADSTHCETPAAVPAETQPPSFLGYATPASRFPRDSTLLVFVRNGLLGANEAVDFSRPVSPTLRLTEMTRSCRRPESRLGMTAIPSCARADRASDATGSESGAPGAGARGSVLSPSSGPRRRPKEILIA
jgi:hypothetical protein